MVLSVYFCMTKTDLLTVIRNIEQELSLHYINAQSYASKEVEEYHSLEEYGMLGINTSGNLLKEFFLVMDKSTQLSIREVPQLAGGIRYVVDQRDNQDSVVICPGGIYQEEFLVGGFVKTVSRSETSQKLMKTFQKFIKKQSNKKVGSFYIGKDAEGLNGKVRYITINVKQSEEYDLKF